MALESLRKVFGQPAPEFFIDVIENSRGIGLLLERLGRSDSALFGRMTRRKYAASACVVLSDGRVDERKATAATKPTNLVVWPKLKAIGERADLVVHYVRERNLLHRPSMARDRTIAKPLFRLAVLLLSFSEKRAADC